MNLIKYKKLLSNHIESGFVFYFALLLIFLIGIIIGSLLIKAIDFDVQDSILNFSCTYFYNTNKGITSNFNIFKTSVLFRTIFVLIIYIVGLLSLGIIVPLLIFLQGGVLGFNVGYLINSYGLKGFLVSIFSYYPQYLLYIPCFIAIGAFAMTMAFKYKISTTRKVVKVKRLDIIDYTIFIFIFTFIILVGSLYEGFISPIFLNLLI
ncbi:stage II sporulation protein M [Tissierella sp. Yu-01]|uniref:stage II sporulation protein M n=1 Tax=Tissierella sp. Yu-01 TaxID=3035694 RepID=UPI00240E1DA6|nr:stage II sporulation protein M [Tissierella sp. Yu-01]WFA09705.1 stage II sporulation protein M [Tissierella sp. Yu-01]